MQWKQTGVRALLSIAAIVCSVNGHHPYRTECGFAFIELSIRLVVIRLDCRSVLAGQELISAAGLRATISQIEKYSYTALT